MRPIARRSEVLLCGLLLAAFISGCACCGDTFAGSEGNAVEVVPTVYQYGQGYVVVEDGDVLPIVMGSQGGMMVVAGARAQNVDTCGASVSARLIRTGASGYQTVVERNLIQREDGWAELVDDDGSLGVMLFPCDEGIQGVDVPWTLEVTVTDVRGNSGTGTRTLIPTCEGVGEWCRDRCSVPDGGY